MMDPPTFSKSKDAKKERERRSSILKIGKSDDDNAPTQTANYGRRVSFADTHQVQEFLLFDSGHSENTSELIEKSTIGEYPLKLDLPVLPSTRPNSATVVDENSAEMSLTLTIDNTIHCPKGTTVSEIVRHPTQSELCHNYNLEEMSLIDEGATVTEVKNKPFLYHQSDFQAGKSSEIDVNLNSKNIEYTQYSKDMSLTGAINKTIYTSKNDQNLVARSNDLLIHEKENVNVNQLPQESDSKSNVSDMIFTRVINKTIYLEPKFGNEEDILVNLDVEEPSNVTKYSCDMSLTRHINKTIFQENDADYDEELTQHNYHIFHQPEYDNLPNSMGKNVTKYAEDKIEDKDIETLRNNIDSYKDEPNPRSEVGENSKKPANVLTPKRDNNTGELRLYAELSKPVSLKKKIKPVRHSNSKGKSQLQRAANFEEITTDFGVEYKLNDNNEVVIDRTPSKRKSSESEDVISKYERKLESQIEVKQADPAPQKTRSGVKKISLFSKQGQNLCVIKPGSSITPRTGKTLTQSNKQIYSTEPQEIIPIPLSNPASVDDVDVIAEVEKEIKSKPSRKTFKLPQFLVKSNRELKNKLDQRVKKKQAEDIKISPDSLEREKPDEVDDLLLVTMPSWNSFSDDVDGNSNPNIGRYKLDQGKVDEVGKISDEVDVGCVSPTKVESIETRNKNKAKKATDNILSVKGTEFKTGDTKPKALDSSVTKPKALKSSFTKPKVLDPSVTKPKSLDSPVTKPKVPHSSVTKPKVPDSSVTKPKVPDSSVTKPKVPDSSVTKPKVPDSSVTKPKVLDSSITKPKVLDSSVTKPKVLDSPTTKPKTVVAPTTKPETAKSNPETKLETVDPPAKLAEPSFAKPKADLDNKNVYCLENSMANNIQSESDYLTTNMTSLFDGQKEYWSDLSQIGNGEFIPPISSTEILKPKVLKTCIEEVLDRRPIKGSEIVKEYLSDRNEVVFEFPEWKYRVCVSFSHVDYEWYITSIFSVNLLNPSKKLEWFEELAFVFVKYQLKELNFEEKQFTINELPKCLNYVTDAILHGEHLQRDCENMELHYETTLNLKEDHAQIIEEMSSLSYRIIFDTIYTIDYKNYATKPITPSFVVKMGTFSSELESNLLIEVEKEKPGPDYIYRVSQIIKQYLRNNPIFNIPPPNKKLISWMY